MTLDLNLPPSSSASAHHLRRPKRTALRLGITRISIATVAVLLLGMASGISRSAGPAEAPPSPTPTSVPLAPAVLESGYTVQRAFTGRVEARRGGPLGFELGGRLAEVHPEEGDLVRRGQVLASLDMARLRARLSATTAVRDRAEAQHALARSTLRKVEAARARDAVSSLALDEAILGLESRQAELEEARAEVQRIQVELAKSRLLAPYDAVVVERLVDEGQVMAAGAPIVQLLEIVAPEVRVGIAGEALVALKIGDRLEVEIGNRLLPATLETLLPIRTQGTRSVDAILRLEGRIGSWDGPPEAVLRDGDLARIRLPRRVEAAGFWLPITALTRSHRGLWAAYVAVPPDSQKTPNDVVNEVPHESADDALLERRELELLHEETDRVFVRGALRAGDLVVQSGLQQLVPGLTVRVPEALGAEARGSESRSPSR